MYKITYCHRDESIEHDLYLPGDENLCLTTASLSLEEGKAGELSIGIPDANTAKAGIVCLTDEIIVRRDNKEFFRGRCITEQTDFNLTGTLTVEGILTYLYDTYFPPFEFQGKPIDLLEKIIANHNSYVSSEKQFQIGTVTVEDANDYIARSSEGYNRTLNILSDKFVGDSLGGYFRARVSGGKRYLDYLKTYGTRATQNAKLGQNILDLALEVEYSNLITAVLPLGQKTSETDADGNQTSSYVTVESVNNGDLYIRDAELIKKYGFVCECVEWQDVTEPENLKTKATAYLAQKSLAIEKITLRAVDLYLAGEADEPFQLGDMVPVESTPHGIDQYIELSAMKLDLLNPTNDTLTFGATEGTLTGKSSSDNRNMAESLNNLTMIIGRISSDYINTKILEAEVAKLGYAKIDELEAEVGKFGYLKTETAETTYAKVKQLEATDGKIAKLESISITTDNFKAKVAEINIAEIEKEFVDSAFIKTLQSLEQTVIASTVNTEFVKDLIVGHATLQDLFTEHFTIGSDEYGSTEMDGSTMQFKDANGNVYIQIGTDADGKHSIIVKDEDGNTLINGKGVTEKAIVDDLIINKMIKKKDTNYAGISADRLDIDSVVTSINNGTKTIKSSLIYFDEENQTLNTKLSKMQESFSKEILDQITDNGTYQAWIESSQGNVLKSATSVQLTCNLRKGNTVEDASGTAYRYSWSRKINGIADTWRAAGKTVTIKATDFSESAVYTCEVMELYRIQNATGSVLTNAAGTVLTGYYPFISAEISLYRNIEEELQNKYYTKEETIDHVTTILGETDLREVNGSVKEIADKTNTVYDTAMEHTQTIKDIKQTLNGNNLLRNSETLIFEDYIIGNRLANAAGNVLINAAGCVLII